MKLANTVALVTGGGSGINLALVQLLHESGCQLVIADLALHAQAISWIDSLSQPGKKRIFFQKTDVTDWKQLEDAFDACVAQFQGPPQIVIPGAGLYEPSSNTFWEDRDRNSHYKVLDVNIVHPIKTTRLAVRKLVEARLPGVVLHVSSIAGQRSSIVTPLYTASKHAINSFVRSMAPLDQLAGIKVVGIAPGTVATPLFTEHPEAAKFLDFEKDCLLSPLEIAKAMKALITEAEYPSGTVLEVCDVGNWRKVQLLNDPGPTGPASFTSKKGEAIKDIARFIGIDSAENSSKILNMASD